MPFNIWPGVVDNESIDPLLWLKGKADLLWKGHITPSRRKELEIELIENMRRAGASQEQINAALRELGSVIDNLNIQLESQSPWTQAKPWVIAVLAIIAASLAVSLLGKLGR